MKKTESQLLTHKTLDALALFTCFGTLWTYKWLKILWLDKSKILLHQ